MALHLFVFTRDLAVDPSAVYTIRSALAMRRRGEEVTVFLTEEASASVLLLQGQLVLTRLLDGGVDVFSDPGTTRQLSAIWGVEGVQAAGDHDLGALMVQPAVRTLWC